MKLLIALIVTLFSRLSFANEWKHINQGHSGYNVRLSYTYAYSPETYGSRGGYRAGFFYVDIHSNSPAITSDVEIFEVHKDGRETKIANIKMSEDHSRHSYGKLGGENSYADYIWVGRNYKFKAMMDGKEIKGNFKL
jgi:hypothetical protein